MTIRRQPSDFRVEERLDEAFAAAVAHAPSSRTPFAVYVLDKASLTTPEAVAQFAKAVGVGHGAVEYGGLKDKHAETTQHVSVAARSAAEAATLPADAASPSGGWSARRIGWSPQAVSAKAIGANRFTLVVRDLSKEASDEMTRRSRRLMATDRLYFTNYFGAQRFGSARHGQGWIAERLIAGDFEGALKLAIATPARKDTGKTRQFTRLAATHWGPAGWKKLAAELPRVPEKRCIDALAAGKDFKDAFALLPAFLQALYVEAFQSHLWNRAAHALLSARASAGARMTTDDEFGEMLFVDAGSVPCELLTVNMPLLAPSVELQEPWGPAAAGVLQGAGLTVKGLRLPGLKRPFFGAADRTLFAAASGFTMSPSEPDEMTPKRIKRTVAFDLPRGSYATVVLRSLGQ